MNVREYDDGALLYIPCISCELYRCCACLLYFYGCNYKLGKAGPESSATEH
jgi:hypothetical protein